MHTNFELPRSVGQLTKHDVSQLLYEALKVSGIETQANLSRLSGIPSGTLSNYFREEHMPPQENWNILRKVFNPPETPPVSKEEKKEVNSEDIRLRARKIRSLIFLLKEEIDFFKNSSVETRELLKSCLDNEETGYVVSLIRALFDDQTFQVWKAFEQGEGDFDTE